jgi:opacity protein-like surface antigen
MRKLLLVTLLLAVLSAAVFADDATTMPVMVGRVYVVPTYAFANSEFDGDWKSNKLPAGGGALKAFVLNFAAEYGINDWITAAVQWGPGWGVWSDLDTGTSQKVNVNGVYDLFAGAKFQIVGAKAPVQNETFRFAVAPGVKIPLPGKDFTKEFTKAMAGEDFTAIDPDRHAWGFGARVYFDFVINEYFFINAYNESIFYPLAADVGSIATIGPSQTEAKYGYELTFEVEPHFERSIAEGVTFKAGLPLTYTMTPEIKSRVKALGGAWTAAPNSNTAVFSVGPNVGIFLTKTPVPLEFSAKYVLPIIGQNAAAQHSIQLNCKVYFAMPGRPQ